VKMQDSLDAPQNAMPIDTPQIGKRKKPLKQDPTVPKAQPHVVGSITICYSCSYTSTFLVGISSLSYALPTCA
jgi:hypothetical protein